MHVVIVCSQAYIEFDKRLLGEYINAIIQRTMLLLLTVGVHMLAQHCLDGY